MVFLPFPKVRNMVPFPSKFDIELENYQRYVNMFRNTDKSFLDIVNGPEVEETS